MKANDPDMSSRVGTMASPERARSDRLHPPSEYGSDPAIGYVTTSCYESGLSGGEKSNDGRDIFGLAASAQRTALHITRDFLWIGLIPVPRNVGSYVSWHNRIDRDSVWAENRRHGLYHRVDAALGRAVMDLSRCSDVRSDRTDADDAPPRASGHHDAGRLLAGKEDSAKVDVVDLIPQVFGDVEQFQHRTNSSIVHENVDPTVPFHYIAQHVSHGCCVGYVGLIDFTVATNPSHHPKSFLGRAGKLFVGATRVVNHHIGSFRGQAHRDGAAYAARGTGDHCDLATKTHHCCCHESFLLIYKMHCIKPFLTLLLQFQPHRTCGWWLYGRAFHRWDGQSHIHRPR